MNLILTKKCNKGCPYCFAHQSRVEEPNCEMSLDQVISIVENYDSSSIKLLGGEPTCHPQFMEIVNSILERGKSVTIISNFLFDNKIKNFIIRKISQGADLHFLVNSTDLDVGDRIKTRSSNYRDIYNILYSFDKEETLS